MDGSGDEVLAHAAFPAEHDGRVGIGDVLEHLADRAHGGTAVEQRRVLGEIPFTMDFLGDDSCHCLAVLVVE